MPGIIGKKIGMTRIFGDDGARSVVTVIECEPNVITQVKTSEKDGYSALVLGFSKLKNPRKTKQFKKVKEFKISDEQEAEFKKGGNITIENFEKDELIKLTATSKGKGFQGVIKRHNFSRGPESHGSHHHREPGSIGACTKPGRVAKGKKMPGRHGGATVSLNKVKITHIDPKKNLLCVRGPVPGPNGGIVTISKY